jgi:hypothetical protein
LLTMPSIPVAVNVLAQAHPTPALARGCALRASIGMGRSLRHRAPADRSLASRTSATHLMKMFRSVLLAKDSLIPSPPKTKVWCLTRRPGAVLQMGVQTLPFENMLCSHRELRARRCLLRRLLAVTIPGAFSTVSRTAKPAGLFDIASHIAMPFDLLLFSLASEHLTRWPRLANMQTNGSRALRS